MKGLIEGCDGMKAISIRQSAAAADTFRALGQASVNADWTGSG